MLKRCVWGALALALALSLKTCAGGSILICESVHRGCCSIDGPLGWSHVQVNKRCKLLAMDIDGIRQAHAAAQQEEALPQ